MKNLILITLAIILLSTVSQVDAKRGNLSLSKTKIMNVGKQPTWQELFDNFMEGLAIDEMIDNSTNCVHYVEAGYQDISEAINHFVTRGWTFENYLDFLGSLSHATPITRTCFDVVVEGRATFAEYIAEFDGFIDFANQAAQSIITNPFPWIKIGTDIFNAITSKRPKEVAFNIGVAIRTFFAFAPKMYTEINAARRALGLPDLRPIEDFMRGFLEGSQVFSSDNISNCLNYTEFVVKSVEDANREFGKGGESGFRNGVFEIADVAEVLRPLNEACINGGFDIKSAFLNIYKTFGSPIDIVLNAARHMNQISFAAIGAWQDFRNGNWHSLGKELGQIFYFVFTTN